MASHGYEVGRLLLLYNEIEINITFLTESIYSNQRGNRMDNRKFGAMIAAMRKAAMTQKDLAERLGVSAITCKMGKRQRISGDFSPASYVGGTGHLTR